MPENVDRTGARGETPAVFRRRLQTVNVLTPSMTQSSGDSLGYLHGCIDKRFARKSSEVFSEVTDLGFGQFWHGATAGGAALIRGSLETLATKGQERDIRPVVK
jgi:hypothetical protein